MADLDMIAEDSRHSANNGPSLSPGTDHAPPQRGEAIDNSAAAKAKRTACVLCRKRKLRCDGQRPACGTCGRLGHECKYDEVRKKSGPKRGYVKALEARLAQVETMLKTQEGPETGSSVQGFGSLQDLTTMGMADPADLSGLDHPEIMRSNSNSQAKDVPLRDKFPPRTNGLEVPEVAAEGFESSPFELIALGLEEPLPTREITDELNQLYFQKVHSAMPMMHRARFYSALNLAPSMRPPVCLRYAMWALAASASDKYEKMHTHFYRRARKYLELDEMRGFGQTMLTLCHCQAWILVAMYEFKNMFFPRAWMSTGRAIRLTQMLSLHRLDGVGLDVKVTIPTPKDWTEREERRRTFWLTYWCDRCASIGTGWPMSFEEKDILTHLPAPEDAFQNNRPTKTVSLHEGLQGIHKDSSSIAGTILMATLFGRNLTHLHRPDADDNEDDLNGKFWQRHRSIDSILLNIKLTLPDHLRIPLGIGDPNVVFLNMCLHASAICLHQAAIFKAEQHRLPPSISSESKMRCIAAASEIATIMRSVAHMDLIHMNPFMAFCLYVAARVFVQFLRARPNELQVVTSLQFLLSAMHAMTKRNPLTESFIAQLELDMESANIPNPHHKRSGLQMVKERGIPEYAMPKTLAKENERPNPLGCGTVSLEERPNGESSDPPSNTNNPQSTRKTGGYGVLPFQDDDAPSTSNVTSNDEISEVYHIHDAGLLSFRQEEALPYRGTPAPSEDANATGSGRQYPQYDAMDLTPDGSVMGGGSGSSTGGGGGSNTTHNTGRSTQSPPSNAGSIHFTGQQKLSQPQQQQQQQQSEPSPPPPSQTSYFYSDPAQFNPSSFSTGGLSLEDFSAFIPQAPPANNMMISGPSAGSAEAHAAATLPVGWDALVSGPEFSFTPGPSANNAGPSGPDVGAMPQWDSEEWATMLEGMSGFNNGLPVSHDHRSH